MITVFHISVVLSATIGKKKWVAIGGVFLALMY